MCGIVGYVGNDNAVRVVTQGLCDVSYRGYHAAGVACNSEKGLLVKKCLQGEELPTEKLHQSLSGESAVIGIGHTRWPTHGANTINNAHPHTDQTETIYVVHNGTIANFDILKKELSKTGKKFSSDTDTEIIAHLIAQEYLSTGNLAQSVTIAVKKLEGAFAIAVIAKDNMKEMVVACMGSPLVIGVNDNGCTVASDEVVLMRQFTKVIEVKDGEVVIVRKEGASGNTTAARTIQSELQEVSKEGFDDYMEKEIAEQGNVIERAVNFGGRINFDFGIPNLGGLKKISNQLRSVSHVIVVGCGTAYHAGLIIGQYLKTVGGIPVVEVQHASEFDFTMVNVKETLVVVISQSGETYDTKIAAQEAKKKGLITLGIVNRVGSSIARETNCGIYCQAGVEVSVASTKVFMSQITIGFLLALYMGRMRKMSVREGKRQLHHVMSLIEVIPAIYKNTRESMVSIAKKVKRSNYIAFVGKGMLKYIAQEGALKMKEITYIPSEGFPAGELKHGPLAVISKKSTVIILCDNENIDSILVTAQEVQVIGCAMVMVVTEEHYKRTAAMFPRASIVVVPNTAKELEPHVFIVPLQLLAYFVAKELNHKVDTPRNIAKSVTVA